MTNTGIHHISVMSSNVEDAFNFYHEILGLKLTMKTVNQEDSRMYHLFFGDENGNEGTEYTVFEMKRTKPYVFGTNALERTMFLVPNEESLYFWKERLDKFDVFNYDVEDYGSKKILRFEDEDGQRLGFEYEENIELSNFTPYVSDDIPKEHAILGISSLHMRVRYLEPTERMLENTFSFKKINKLSAFGKHVVIFQFDNKFKHKIHVIVDKDSPNQHLGVGAIHHIAFGVENIDDLSEIVEDLDMRNIARSELKNRDFMHSLYFRDATRNVIEVATPISDKGIIIDQKEKFENIELFLPEFLEDRREEIENYLN